MKSTTSISDKNNEAVVNFLNLLLANEYVLYTNTRAAHWNVDGSNYFELHVFMENQSIALDDIIDNIAEQIRSLGHFALGSLKDFITVARMSYNNYNFSNSEQIFETLLKDHKTIICMIQQELYPISDKFKDRCTADFLARLIEQHEKMIRLIKSFLSNPVLNANNHLRIIYNQSVNRQT